MVKEAFCLECGALLTGEERFEDTNLCDRCFERSMDSAKKITEGTKTGVFGELDKSPVQDRETPLPEAGTESKAVLVKRAADMEEYGRIVDYLVKHEITLYSTALEKDVTDDPDWVENVLDVMVAEKDAFQACRLIKEMGVNPDIQPEEQGREEGAYGQNGDATAETDAGREEGSGRSVNKSVFQQKASSVFIEESRINPGLLFFLILIGLIMIILIILKS